MLLSVPTDVPHFIKGARRSSAHSQNGSLVTELTHSNTILSGKNMGGGQVTSAQLPPVGPHSAPCLGSLASKRQVGMTELQVPKAPASMGVRGKDYGKYFSTVHSGAFTDADAHVFVSKKFISRDLDHREETFAQSKHDDRERSPFYHEKSLFNSFSRDDDLPAITFSRNMLHGSLKNSRRPSGARSPSSHNLISNALTEAWAHMPPALTTVFFYISSYFTSEC